MIRRFAIVFCDLCGEHSFDDPQEDTPSARDELRKQGWRTILGKDICPNHAELLTPRQVREAMAVRS